MTYCLEFKRKWSISAEDLYIKNIPKDLQHWSKILKYRLDPKHTKKGNFYVHLDFVTIQAKGTCFIKWKPELRKELERLIRRERQQIKYVNYQCTVFSPPYVILSCAVLMCITPINSLLNIQYNQVFNMYLHIPFLFPPWFHRAFIVLPKPHIFILSCSINQRNISSYSCRWYWYHQNVTVMDFPSCISQETIRFMISISTCKDQGILSVKPA